MSGNIISKADKEDVIQQVANDLFDKIIEEKQLELSKILVAQAKENYGISEEILNQVENLRYIHKFDSILLVYEVKERQQTDWIKLHEPIFKSDCSHIMLDNNCKEKQIAIRALMSEKNQFVATLKNTLYNIRKISTIIELVPEMAKYFTELKKTPIAKVQALVPVADIEKIKEIFKIYGETK